MSSLCFKWLKSFPLSGAKGVYFYHHEAMRSKVSVALVGLAVHTEWHPDSLGYPRANSTVLDCTKRPQETGLKIQSIALFKGSAGNSWNQTVEGKRCVLERWLMLKATHSSLMHGQVRKKQNKTGFSGANSKDVAGLRMSIFETHTRGFSVFVGLENNAPHPCCIETKTKQKNVELNV